MRPTLTRLAIASFTLFMAACQTINPDTTDQPKAFSTVSQLLPGISSFQFVDWAGPDIPVWVFIPEDIDRKDAPVLFVMHGTKRDSERYLREWAPYAQQKGVVIVAPQFSKNDFPRSAGYNLGNIFEKEGSNLKDQSLWSFSAIEPLFDYVTETLSNDQNEYTLYGHSAGSQFVHRFLYYKPEARVKRYLTANAGWYTLPDMEEAYPYGLKDAKVSEAAYKRALAEDVVILLGDQDTNVAHGSLRHTPEAMRQGPHRFARGLHFYETGKIEAENINVAFGWTTQVVHGVAHSNGGIAKAAISFVE